MFKLELLLGTLVGGSIWLSDGSDGNVLFNGTMKDDSTMSVHLEKHTQYTLTLTRIADITPERMDDPAMTRWRTYVEGEGSDIEVSEYQWFEQGTGYSWTFTAESKGEYALSISNNIRGIVHTTEFPVIVSTVK